MFLTRTQSFCLIGFVSCLFANSLSAQNKSIVQKALALPPQSARTNVPQFHLLPSEEEQEAGNAVPVLLRIVYEQQAFMKDVYPKLHEYAEMDTADPRFKDFYFARFADQLIRAGSMSYADWHYPIRGERPYLVLLPDIQSQRQLAGRGMTAWIRLLLSKQETEKALNCIKAQLSVGRHCAATPVVVCHLVGLALANTALDNLELAMQSEDCPNMYWSLGTLPATLQDIGPMVRWELWASPARLNEPLPAIGDKEWTSIATKFVDTFGEVSAERYTKEEGAIVQLKMQELAKQELPKELGFTEQQIDQMSAEELIMRWIYLHYCQMRTQIEPLAFQSPLQVIKVKRQIEAKNQQLLEASGAKSSPYMVVLPQGILACKNFERRVKFLQTIESLRDYASKHEGQLPKTLDELELPAPNDPFTEKPFLYALKDDQANLQQEEVDGSSSTVYHYTITVSEKAEK